jgi:hypothetical protein
MKKTIVLALVLVVISISGCKKSKADCEENNYGVMKVTYGLSTDRHSIVITAPNPGENREKITAIGVTSDTLHLAPATYTLSISSINGSGLAIESKDGSATITQCNENSTSVSF